MEPRGRNKIPPEAGTETTNCGSGSLLFNTDFSQKKYFRLKNIDSRKIKNINTNKTLGRYKD